MGIEPLERLAANAQRRRFRQHDAALPLQSDKLVIQLIILLVTNDRAVQRIVIEIMHGRSPASVRMRSIVSGLADDASSRCSSVRLSKRNPVLYL